MSDQAVTRRRGRPSNGELTMVQQMARYNELVDEAVAKGLKFRKLGQKSGSTFATRAQGQRAIAKIQAAIDAV